MTVNGNKTYNTNFESNIAALLGVLQENTMMFS